MVKHIQKRAMSLLWLKEGNDRWQGWKTLQKSLYSILNTSGIYRMGYIGNKVGIKRLTFLDDIF